MADPPDPAGGGPVELLPLALSRPQEALDRARALLAAGPGPLDAAVAHQAIGIVLREFGDVEAAVTQLRTARALARRAGATGREADVLATLGVALVYAGRPGPGRRALGVAVLRSSGHLRGRILQRRALVLVTLGRHREAMADLDGAVPALRAAGDAIWQARARTVRAFVRLSLASPGSVEGARRDLEAAERLCAQAGQDLESADAVANLGILAQRLGDLPTALARYEEATERAARAGVRDYDLVTERCETLLAAGLARDAHQEVSAAIRRADGSGLRPTRRAELLLSAASCALAAGDPRAALDRATEAGRLFARQGRPWWQVHARMTRVRAALAVGAVDARLLADARRCVRDLEAVSSPELLLGRLTAGRIALALGRRRIAEEYLRAAADRRRRGPALDRAQAWLAEALRAEAAGDTRRVRHACRRGLQVIVEHRAVLGSQELRAQVTAHGAELAHLGQRHAGGPRSLLVWSERWRAVAHAVPAVRPPDDGLLQADLAAMRSVGHRLAEGLPVRGSSAYQLERERQRLERAVRARELRRRAGEGDDRPLAVVDPRALLAALGPDRLVELADVDGRLQVLVCGRGTVRRFEAGTSEQAVREVLFARFALTRLGSRVTASAAGAAARPAALGAQLERVLLGEAAAHLGDGRVVLVPPGRLHAVPWALLPGLAGRAFSVAPSATSWLRARQDADAAVGPGADWRVVLVRGPGLGSQGQEVPLLEVDYGPAVRPVVLGSGTATVSAVLAAIDGAALVHIAAHGTFRADSPLFSSLLLDDGPLTLYDLARLRRGPGRLVLSSCDSAVVAPVGADEILGLASSLLPLGTTGIVASVVPVDDAAVGPLMVHLHRRLRAGAGLADALRDVRLAAGDDPLARATADSFIALGADAGPCADAVSRAAG